jgi:hypothetical protein
MISPRACPFPRTANEYIISRSAGEAVIAFVPISFTQQISRTNKLIITGSV